VLDPIAQAWRPYRRDVGTTRTTTTPVSTLFGDRARDYDDGRPEWPPGLIGDLPGCEVIELGAGTGKLTRLLAGQFSSVTAVEPDLRMRNVLTKRCPSVAVCTTSAEQVDRPDGSFDLAFAGMCAHFFEPRAFAEIARLLRPGGQLLVLTYLPVEILPPPSSNIEAIKADYATTEEIRDLVRRCAWHDPANVAGFSLEDVVSTERVEGFGPARLASYIVSRSDVRFASDAERDACWARLAESLCGTSTDIRFEFRCERWSKPAFSVVDTRTAAR
jgi:SAM-dependent methyltransferase